MRSLLLIVGLSLCTLGCQGSPVIGTYRFVERAKGASGSPYAEWLTLTLSDGGRMSFDGGDLTVALGRWKEANGRVTLSNVRLEMLNEPIALSYRSDGRDLIPQTGGQDAPSWRFERTTAHREW